MDFRKTFIIFLILFILLFIRIHLEVNTIKVESITINTKKIPKNKKIKIVHISDLHNKKFSNNNIALLKKIENLRPDIIALTGDIIDAKTTNFRNVYSLLEDLMKINKDIYYVSGNHEWRNKKIEEFIYGLKSKEIKIINNSNEIYKYDNFSVNICGIDDPYTNHEDIEKAFSNIDKNNFTLLLSHAPNIIFKSLDLLCDLVLCGHTHGGQIRIPFIGGIIAPGQGLFPRYDKGLFKIKNDILLYINSGLGTSRLPIRFLNKSQISFITLTGE
ncbi:metallophosphoesterase [Paramaledivibacter caminithermalis]|jgi:predicted MPP superfamily phosphohydrolase|uniref:Calcineurin-like phosphoesterase domain-containing protein n=1 Tax=Paramaledivibacter caminithermalis (strain DSM 15212 / CIP 107654 / DViRD3) TaxID=1121301 RepID=A0A1M6PU11_PARC5|nr:metallophosphoesterase [Paramaledivibacter caminithermalis]SHK11464.1 hypothetical protein SAMN02745912_02286 [Paramaledivibacter caminithermalis DSM 15212]